jgi:SWI/SNF-related matrix-associated actin-dependent regulator 1 of chromatin subfamily A
MSILKQLAVKGKMEATIEWIEDFLQTGEKLVVFAINKEVVQTLMKAFPNAARVDGSVSHVKRQKAVDSFQTDPNCNLFVANMDAGGIGLTLTAASNVMILQYPWTAGKLVQAVDRVHRITQLKKVTVWNTVAAGTIEEKIIKVLAENEKMIADVLDGGQFDEVALATAILKQYKK